jgi:hypothetical protein
MAKLPEELQQALLRDPRSNIDPSDLSVDLKEINAFGDTESMKRMFGNVAAYNKMLKERITFINEDISRAIPFTRENLYLIAAYTGSGKSSCAANISYPLWKEGKKTLIISNEESEQDVLYRIACLEIGLNFNDYKKGFMPIEDQKRAMVLFPQISQYVKVLDVNYKNGLTTKLEGVQNALTAVQHEDYSCALIDYYQLIKYSAHNKAAKTYDVLNDLRVWLGRYIKNSNIPIVMFTQLHSIGKRNNKDIDSRVKECPAIIEPATVVIEMIPNFTTQTTSFCIVKDRFGLQGTRIECAYSKGRFVAMPEDEVQRVADIKRQQAEKKLDELTDKINGK